MEQVDERCLRTDALALGALDAEERVAAEAHLAACPLCRARLPGLRDVAALLALAAPSVAPPPALGARLLARAAMERPARRRPVLWGWLAAAAVLVALLGWNVALQMQLGAESSQVQTLTARLATQDLAWSVLAQAAGTARTLPGAEGTPQAQGTFYLDPRGTSGILVVRGFPATPPGKVYQLWLIEGEQRTNGGLFTVDESGKGTLVVRAPKVFESYRAAGVTTEPAGGSPGPTSRPVITGRL